MMSCGFGFSIVIADQARDEGAPAPFQAGNVAIPLGILAVLMVSMMPDQLSLVVQQSTRFQEDASLRGQTVHGMQLVKELKTQLAHMFCVVLVVFEAPSKTARAHEQLARCAIVAMRFLAGEHFVRELLQKAIANPDARYGKQAKVQIASQRDKRYGGDAHHIGAVSSHAVGLHTFADIALKNGREPFPQQGQLY